ncbi:hypothetical protein [Mesorhizobium sp. J428]|uniref:hypothetical protein n=1 Tax=Mesorhizobium sp. J428 TaxID=2898440 RepID=UPI002151FC77|nr:hypothetical protein [Mesorhizobium sp. J428]MCR5857414.1 hypothetical protein [Mesorhizobium sp. J428]
MRKLIKALAIASAVIAGLAAAPALYAHDSEGSDDAMMGSGMMGMMGQMSEMMEGCNRMMQSMSHDGTGRPNEQWREKSPDYNGAPGTNG